MRGFSAIFCVLLCCSASLAQAKERIRTADWLAQESIIAVQKIDSAISQEDTARGAVIASPSKNAPNYYYHWVRDGALTMDLVVSLYQKEQEPKKKAYWRRKLEEYLDFSLANQKANTLTGLGEPKFYVDGSSYNEPWGRPQNDGPALRTITFFHFAEILIANGETDFVREKLYDSQLPSNTLIKRDLEYISHEWPSASFDLWEEVLGDHFYTRMVQRKALLLGSQLARQLGDLGAADWYYSQGKNIETSLNAFWNAQKEYIEVTKNWRAGVDYKNSGLDVAVLLGALHGGMDDGFFSVSDDRVQKTVRQLEAKFYSLYPINHWRGFPGVAAGRYPEDHYDGSAFQAGNPWVLATLAIAEHYYRLGLINQGDQFTDRVQVHANPDGTLSEQIQRNSGYMVSAENLTWNYAAILTTFEARKKFSNLLQSAQP